MIYCHELLFGVLSPYHYLNIETMNIISSYAREYDFLFEMDWEEYFAETPNSKILCHLPCKDHDKHYLELVSIMLFQLYFIT